MISSLPAKKESLLLHNLWEKVLNNIYGLEIPQKELDTEPFNYPLSFIDKTYIEKNTSTNYGLSKQVGGTSNLWSGRVSPLDKEDFECKNKYLNGWPIDFYDLENYYKLACRELKINYDSIWGPNSNYDKYVPNK